MSEQQTIVELWIERETRKLLSSRDDYRRANREQRERIEHEVRNSIITRMYEDDA